MDFAPVSDQGENQQYGCDHELARGLGGIHGMPMVSVRRLLFGRWSEHADIVALRAGIRYSV